MISHKSPKFKCLLRLNAVGRIVFPYEKICKEKIKMAIDLKRTHSYRTDSIPLAVGATVSEEGQGLISVLVGGVEHVLPSAGAGGETFAGFASFRQLNYSTAPNVELLTVPAAAPYTIQLQFNNLLAGQVRVYDVLNAVDLLVVGGIPAAGQVNVNVTTGLLTFNAAEGGLLMKIYYRWNLTVYQAQTYYYQAATNYPDPNFFGQVGVMKGKGRLHTSYYDQSIDWSAVAPGTITLGAAGILTVGGAGPLVPNAYVVKAPDVGVTVTSSAQFLGIEYNC